MSTIDYAGSKPITGLWVLDNGEKVFAFTSVVVLTLALVNDYAKMADSPKRAPSLQWMGADGYCDATVLLGEPTGPANLPDDTASSAAARDAMDKHMIGDSGDWYALITEANKLRSDHRIELARKVRTFHSTHCLPTQP